LAFREDMDVSPPRDVFITSFRKAFSILGVDPDDFVVLGFDHRSRTVVAVLDARVFESS
jgi:hypothetical protein